MLCAFLLQLAQFVGEPDTFLRRIAGAHLRVYSLDLFLDPGALRIAVSVSRVRRDCRENQE
jgi:hypothetical protein